MGGGGNRGGGGGLICCFCVGLGCFIAGIVFIAKGGGASARNVQISTFNAAVSAWTPTMQAAFAARSWNVTSTDPGAANFALSPSSGLYEQSSIEQGSDIAPLSAVPRTAFGSVLSPFAPMSGPFISPSSNNNVRTLVVTETVSGAVSRVPITLASSFNYYAGKSSSCLCS